MDFRDSQEASGQMAGDTMGETMEAVQTMVAAAGAALLGDKGGADRKLETRGDLQGSEAATLPGRGRSFA
ncbi:hypothetical protein H5J25_04990 [Sphingomonas aliaeris]|uniref:Uncharacterized protein n=1 Tax=Sphingomonas aliaeris TaxID=2759526 RepID=A0A974NWA5_9SPHN|nr:hypothetical protein [Sphingomonas aliaeris]QQV78091.1 hypothetical protein H5J25_04990 [Sphingomonas aliaeris]